jgi:hypothetical protein
MRFVSNEEADDRILGLSRDENLETFLDYETGKQLYIGRVRPPDAS